MEQTAEEAPETTTGVVVQKVPVPCWPTLDALNETLPPLARVFKA